MLGLVPPDPSSLSSRDLLGLLKLGAYGASLGEKEIYRIAKLMTQSSADLLDEWFEFDPLKGTKSASGIIGTFLGPRSPGTAYVLLHHYMGEIDGAFRAWGFAKGGTGGVSAAIASSARALGVEIRTGARGEAGDRARRPRLRRGARERRRVRGQGGDVRRRPEAHLPAVRRRAAPARRVRDGDAGLPRARLVGQGEHRALRAAAVHLPARRRPAASRRDLDQPEHRLHRARLRRGQVRPVLAPTRTSTSSSRR